ncbi:MAG: SGNH/GDSL hydrolase family protein [Planctomycetota bacterium]
MRRSGKLCLGVCLFFLLLELGLRLTGFVYLQINRRSGVTAAPRAILCLGDSHTFGIWLKNAETYPAQLEQLLNQGETTKTWAVVNRGVPGMASGDVLARLEESISERKWDAVVVTVGVNDRLKGAERKENRAWYDSIQIVKLTKIIIEHSTHKTPAPRKLDPNAPVHPDEIAGTANKDKNTATISIVDRSGNAVAFDQLTTNEELNDLELKTQVARRLGEMVDIAAKAGTKLIFVSYLKNASTLGLANSVMKQVATDRKQTFVDTTENFAAAEKEYRFEDLYFPDLHPTSGGCVVISRTVFNALADEKLVTKPKITNITAALPKFAGEEAPFEIHGSLTSGDLSIRAKTDPGRLVHLFISNTEGPPAELLGHRIPIGKDALFDKTVDVNNPKATQAVAGVDGIATIPIAALVGKDTKTPMQLFVAAAIMGKNGDPGLHKITGAKKFTLQ